MQTVTAFVSTLVALSLGVERVIEILKGFSAYLRQDPDPAVDPTGRQAARRRAIIQILAALIGTGTAFLIGPDAFLSSLHGMADSAWKKWGLAALLGLMASGGSAFWNHVLDIVDSVKKTKEDIQTAAAQQRLRATVQARSVPQAALPMGP